MTEHDRCLIDTMSLELELYGQVRSPSVLDHVKRLDEDMRIRAAMQYGGSRALLRMVGTPAGPGRLAD